MSADLLPFTGWECPSCGWLARDSAEQIGTHRCAWDLDSIDIRSAKFIQRWGWKENLVAMRQELDELIALATAASRGAA